MTTKQEIKKILEKQIKSFTKENINFSVETSPNKNYGDYSTNVAMVLAKKIGENPKEVAEDIIFEINASLIRANKRSQKKNIFEKIEIAGPGFINFFINEKIFIDNLKKINKDYGKGVVLKNKKIVIDYTDPNPFKEFHIGHLMSNAIGESLSRIFEFQGVKVKRVCFQGDVGIHIAKSIWGVKKIRESRPADFKENLIKDWAQGYAYGSQMFEEDKNAKKEIQEFNKKIYEKTDKEINKLYEQGKKLSLEQFEKIYEKLGTKFNALIFESQVVDFGKKIVEKGLKNKIFEKGEKGAIIFKGEKYGLHTRVFINSEGLPTYEAKDLGLAELKYKKYKYDKSVVITANEQNSHFAVMLCAMEKVLPELAKKTKHISHGMMKLPDGKMSSRTGNIITAESLIEKVEQLVNQKIKEKDFSEKEKLEILEKVAIGALKYSILKQSIGSDIIYDFDKSISFEGDSGPYLQYSYARAKSVLEKASKSNIKPSFKKVPEKITQLEKTMYYFPEIIEKANNNYQPNIIALYLIELAREFNNYYSKNKIVDTGDEFSPYKVALTSAFAQIMKNGLWLLGIKTLEKM
jgi:arginyl-tRNA synthetase